RRRGRVVEIDHRTGEKSMDRTARKAAVACFDVQIRRRQVPLPVEGSFDATRPLGVYVHFPFCSVRCPYCDFAVDTRREIPHDGYADAVIRELEVRRPWFTAD